MCHMYHMYHLYHKYVCIRSHVGSIGPGNIKMETTIRNLLTLLPFLLTPNNLNQDFGIYTHRLFIHRKWSVLQRLFVKHRLLPTHANFFVLVQFKMLSAIFKTHLISQCVLQFKFVSVILKTTEEATLILWSFKLLAPFPKHKKQAHFFF